MTKDANRRTTAPPGQRSEAGKSEGAPNDHSAFRQAYTGDEPLPPITPGFVRPLTDPEAVERWLAESETPNVVWDYDPFANWRLR